VCVSISQTLKLILRSFVIFWKPNMLRLNFDVSLPVMGKFLFRNWNCWTGKG